MPRLTPCPTLRSTLRSSVPTCLLAGGLLLPMAVPAAAADPLASSLTLTASTTQVVYGVQLGLTGALTRADGSPVVDAPVTVWSRTLGQAGRIKVGEGRTNTYGRVQVKIIPRTNAEYEMRYAGDVVGTVPTAPVTSNLVASNVQPRVTGAFNPASVPLKASSVLSGRLSPAYSGARLTIRRRAADGSYSDIAIVGTDSTGAYRWTATPGLIGSYVFRVVLPAQPAHLSSYTPPLGFQVDPRQLRQGDSGGDVASLERRLAAQKADVGRVDGVFDYDLKHALFAFQKSQGLPRTGVYDRATSNRLAAPVPVTLRHPSAGRAVEIDLRKQVLYLSQGGVLQRMVDISSGSNELYESEGVTYRATTPLGSFRVTRKIDGVRVSRLGELYRPAYFYSGWAIHGSKSVPTYPASHGCIRVTNPAQDRLFALLTVGTPVTVYAG
jgi:peptidoglycan hydrolase-like protein with peptidoglycan-binding domain